MNKILMTAVLACASMQLNAMQPDSVDKLIEFQGEQKCLLGWIMASQLDPKHPFSTTSLVRAAGNQLTVRGDILSMEEEDVQAVADQNCVYCPFYALLKTRLSQGQYVETGAIIVGTKDAKVCDQLHFAHMRKLMNQSKQ